MVSRMRALFQLVSLHQVILHQGLVSALLTRKHSEQSCEIFWSYDNRTSGNNLENFNIKILTKKKYSSVCIYNFLHTWAEENLWCASTTFVKKSVSNTHLLPSNTGYSPLFGTEIECSFMGHLISEKKKLQKLVAGIIGRCVIPGSLQNKQCYLGFSSMSLWNFPIVEKGFWTMLLHFTQEVSIRCICCLEYIYLDCKYVQSHT